MNLATLSNNDLHESLKTLAAKERETTVAVLHHLREVERRMLYAELGYPSLWEYTVRELKYSEAAASRRISSMRLLKSLPVADKKVVEQKIEAGTLTLSTLSQAQSFFLREDVKAVQDKKALLDVIEGKSRREVERELVGRASSETFIQRERIRPLSAELSSLTLVVDEEMLRAVEELRGLLAHRLPRASIKDILTYAIKDQLRALKPKAPKQVAPPPVEVEEVGKKLSNDVALVSTTAPSARSRNIPVEMRRQVWGRDEGQCTFVHEATKRRCSSTYALEIDHIVPFAMGGEHAAFNLRLRCPAHNQWHAVKSFGAKKMKRYLPSLS